MTHELLQIVSYRRWASRISIGRLAPLRFQWIYPGRLLGLVLIFLVSRQCAGLVRPERQGQSATDREEQWHGKQDHNSRSHRTFDRRNRTRALEINEVLRPFPDPPLLPHDALQCVDADGSLTVPKLSERCGGQCYFGKWRQSLVDEPL